MKRSVIRNRRPASARRSAPARRPRPLGVSLSRFTSAAAICGALVAGVGSAKAATYYWDADGITSGNNFTTGFSLGGSGIWNTSTPLWWDTTAEFAWPNAVAGDTAIFTGPAGVVQLGGNITVGGLTFNSAGYNINDGTAASKLTLAGGASIFANVVGTNTISSILDGTNGLTLTGAGLTSVIALTNTANTYTGTTTITSGTLNIAGDGSLGNAANGLSFNGALLGGLTFAQSTTLGAGRTVTLGTGATATVTSALNANVNVLGQVTGAGNLTLVNTGVTSLLGTANDFSGTLWAQNGTVALGSLADAAGSGSIRLGNAATTGAVQWGSGVSAPLTLTNRAIELFGAGGGGTIDSSALAAANSVTINSNLLISTAGAKTLTLTGSNIGSNLFAGSIGDSTAGATALTKSGAALWTLSNAANNFTGAVALNLGVLRITNAGAFGSGNFSFGGGNTFNGLELRADGSTTFNRAMSANASTNSYIYVDHAIGSASGTSANQTITIGTLLSGTTSTVGLNFLGEHGYNLNTGVFTLQGKAASNQSLPFINNLGAPGYGAAGFQNGVLTLAGLQTDNVASLSVTSTLSGWGDTVLGPVLNNATNTATPLNITKTSLGLLTFSGSNAGWVNGLLTLSAGTVRVSSAPTGGAVINFGGGNGLLELRNDASTNFGVNSTFNNTTTAVAATILADHAIGGTSVNQVATIGAINSATFNQSLNVVGDHGYGLTTGGVTVGGGFTFSLNNYLNAVGYSAAGYTPGILTIPSVTNSSGAAGTLALGGFGDFATFGTGSVFNTGGGTVNITKGSLGVVTFTGNNAGWTAGTVTASTGVTRLLSGTALGTASLTLNGGLVELRTDANTTFQSIAATPATSTVVAGHTLGATGISNKTLTLGSITGTASTSINLVGDNGYGITTGAVAANNTFTLTLNNDLAAPGYVAGNYTPGVVTIGSLASGTAGTGTIVLGGFGDYANFTGGNIANAGGSTLNLTKNAIGVLTFSGNNSGWTSGTLTASGGTTLIDATNTNAVGSANLAAATSGLLEIRGATGTSGAVWTGKSLTAGNATLVIDPLVGAGTTGQTVNLGAVVGSGVTQLIDSNHGYNLVFNAAATAGNATTTLSNIGNGTATYLGGLTSTAVTSTWAFAGSGDSVVSGNIVDGTGKSALSKSGIGTLTLSGAANTFTGGITLNVGVIKITAPLGTGTGAFNLNNTGSGAPNNNVTAIDIRNNGSLDLSTHGFGRTITQVFNVDNNGSGTNGTMTIGGGMSFQDSAWSILATGANGYSLKIGSATPISMGVAAGAITYTISNYIPSSAGVGNLEIANGITFVNTGSTGNLIFSGTGDFLMSGALTYTAGGTADTITKSGLGTMTLTGNNAVSWNNAAAIYTVTNGILRAGTSANIGGATTTVNLNGGVLDLRNDVGQTLAETITVGAGTTSFINVDRAIGGAGTGQTMTLGGLKIGAGFNVFATNTAANNYSLNTGTLTVNGAAAVFTNNLGGTGTATVPALTGANLAVTLSGSGATNVTGPVTLGTGTLTKAGTGTVTLSGNTANTNGAVSVNGGTLALDYSGGAATNILQSAALTLSNGTLSMKGLAAGASQTLGAVTFNSGNNAITINPNGGTTTLNLGALAGAVSTTAVAGSQLLITSPTNSVVTFNQDLTPVLSQGRNIVFTDGTTYDWAKNTGVNTTTTALGSATALALTGASDALNSNLTGSAVLAATRATNSLKLDSGGAGNSLDLGAFTLTLTQGGLLFVGANDYTIGATGVGALKSATPTNSDLVINQYGAGKLFITAPIVTSAGTTTLTVGGTGTVVLGNAVTANQNTYAGTTTVNGGMLQIVNSTRLGSAATNALTVNGGTFDLNGNNLSIGNFNGAYAGTIDNTAAGAANFSIGGATGSGTFLGTIKNTGGALSITKTGTGTITLGDVNGMSNFTYTGDLTNSGGTTSIIAVTGITDTASTRIKLGTATASDSPTFKYIGNANLILGSRQFDLTGASGGTIDGSGVNGLSGTQGMLVINSDLLLSGAGNKTLTLTGTSGIAAAAGGGSVSGINGNGTVLTINTFAGQIGANNPNSIALGLAVTGTSSWSLTGANTFTGGLTMSSTGVLRGTVGNGVTSGSFGGSGNTITWSGAGQLDLRSDTDQNFGNPIAWGNAALKINVDRAINGSGYGKIMTLGAITEGVTNQTLTVSNSLAAGAQNNGTNMINAYGLRVAGLVLNAGTATTVTSAIGGGSTAYFATPAAGSGVVGAFTIDGISTAASLGTHTLTIGAAGNATPITIITGNITQGSGTSLALTSTGNVLLTLSGQTAATNYSGGLTLNGLGTVRATTPFSLGAGTVSLTNGTLELRGDSSTVYGGNFTTSGAPVSWSGANAVALTIGESLNGTGGHANTFTLGALTLGTGATKALTIGGISGSSNNSGDSVTFGGVVLNGVTTAALTNTVTNNLLLPGVLNLGSITNTTATVGTQTLTIGGSGVTIIGNATNSGTAGALTAINFAGTATGFLDLTSTTAANTYTGGLTVTGGTVRATQAVNLGGGPVIFGGGNLELRSDTTAAANYSGLTFQNLNGGALNIGQLPGGTGDNSYGVPFVLGTLVPTAAAKVLTINGIYGTTANNGNGVTINSVNFTTAANNTTTVTNNLLLPGVLALPSVSNSISTAPTLATLTIAGAGVTTLGDVANVGPGGNAGNTTGINYTGTGILDLSRATAANNYTGGLAFASGSTARVTNRFGLGANTGSAATSNVVTLNGAQLEIRSDSDISFSNTMLISASGTPQGGINVGPLPGGTGVNGATGVNFNLGQLKVTVASKTLAVSGIGSSLAASGDFVNFTGVDLNGIAVTLNNNLLLPSMVNFGSLTSNAASTALALTIGGAGTSLIGDITNGSATGIGVGLTYTGSGILDLSRQTVANTYTGGLTIGGGTVRVANAFGFGAAANQISLNGGSLELRSDTNINYPNAILIPGGGNINVGQLPGGTGNNGGVGVTFGLGLLKTTVTAKTTTFAGIAGTGANSGDSVSFANFDLNNLAASSLTNNLNDPGIVALGNVFSTVPAATAGTAVLLTINGTGFTTMGDLTNGTGGTSAGVVTLTYTGTGTLQVTGTAATNYTGGLNMGGTGTFRTIGANSFGAPTNAIGLTAGTFDVRSNVNLNVPNPITINTNNVAINADQVTSGNFNKTLTFSGAATVLGATAKVLTLTSSSGYGMSFTNGFSDTITGWNITNNAVGPVNLGPISYTSTAGALTIGGSGMTTVGNITGTTAALALTYSGTGLLDLTGNAGATNPMSGLTLGGTGGIVKVASATNLGAANDTVNFNVTGATLQVRSNGAGNNGTIAFGNPITLTSAATGTHTIDVGNAGSNTGNTVAFGSLSNGLAASTNILVVNGANGYGVRFTALTLPNGTGASTTLVANVPLTIAGPVTNAETGFAATNFDTLFLDGAVGGAISGAISDAATGSLTLNGLTRITKQGIGTWTLGSTNNYLGLNTITGGTLKLGANNAIGSAGMGTTITAASGLSATVDLAGFNQTFGLGVGAVVTQTSALILGGGSTTSQPMVIDSVGTGTLTLAGVSTTGDIQYVSTNNPLGGIISAANLNLGNAARTFNVGDSSTAIVDLAISSAIQGGVSGTVTKTGTGTLLLSGALTLPTAATTFFNLGAGAGSLIVTNSVTSTTAQTWTNASFSTTLSGVLDIAGKLDMGANALTVAGIGQTHLANTAAGTGANVLNGGINVNGGVLGGLSIASGASITGTSSLASATLALSGANPIIRLAPALGTSLTSGTTAGLLAKTYQSGATYSSLGATNFMVLGNPLATFTGGFSYLANLPAAGGTVANLPTVTASTAFPATTSAQFTGLLNITTAGVYNFSTTTDDGGLLVIDGSPISSTAAALATGTIYLTAGLHTFNERVNNNTSNGTVSVRYQGPDTAGGLIDIPASAFFQAIAAADLASTFNNNLTLAATTNATIDVAANTTINGSLTMLGTGAGTTLNALGSGNLNTLTISGATTLTDNLAIVTSTANLTLGGAISGPLFGITKSGFGTLSLGGANTFSGPTSITVGTLRLTNANALQNSALSLTAGTVLQLRADATTTFTPLSTTILGNLTIDVDQLTTGQTNQVLTLGGAISLPASTLNVTGNSSATGYSLGLGAVTITGAVVFNPTTANVAVASVNSVAAQNITLGGTSTGNSIGAITTLTGTVTKNTAATWTLSGANTYTGATAISLGTLNLTGSLGNTATTVSGGIFNVNGAAPNALTGTASLIVNNAAATVNINSTVNYTGVTTISNGVVNVNPASGAGINGNTAIALSGGTLSLQKAQALNAGTLTVTGTPTLTETATNAISGTAALTENSATAVVNLNQANNYSGATTLTLGTLSLTTAGAISGSAVTVNGGAFSETVPNALSGTASFKVGNAAATADLNFANNHTGGDTVTAGTLSFVSGGLGSGTINQSGGTLKWDAGNTQDVSSQFATLTGTATFDTNGNNIVFASPVSAGGITKTGLGALTLGTTTLTNNLTLSQGTLNITGPVTGSAAASILAYGGSANPTVVNVNGNFTGFGTTGANVAGSVAVYNQTGGTVTVTPLTANAGQYVAGAAGYGYFNLTGNSIYKASAAAQRFDVTAGASTGVAFIGGNSSLNYASGEHFLVAYNGTGALGQITVADSAVIDHSSASVNLQVFWVSNNAYGVVNVAGGALNNAGRGITFGGGAGNNEVGIVNLAGGTTTATGFTSNNTGTGNKSYINFAGGTYKASAAQTFIGADQAGNIITPTLFGPVDNSSIGGPLFAGGLTVDTNGVLVTSNRSIFGAASSFGVTQTNIAIPNAAAGNANYIGAPAVQFSAPTGGGAPAAGYALISGGVVTGVVITAPGTYATGETPTITFTGGGGTIAPFVTSNLTTANGDAGLTVTGTGTLLLSAANTFSGTSAVIGGATIKIGNAGALTGPLSLGSTGTVGTLDLNGFTTTLSNLLVGTGATVGNQIVTNTSATTLGTLSLNLSGAFSLPAIQINDGGTQRTALTLAGAANVTQTNTYNYTGGTNIQNGSLRVAGADNRLTATSPVTLGNLATSGKLILGGDGVGGTGAGTQRLQRLTQSSATSILSMSGTSLFNSVVGGSAGGTSSGTPDNNSVLTLNIGSGFTDTYAGLIGWDGQGTLGFQNNINLVKTGSGTLFLTGDLTNWTGTGSGPTDPTRPKLLLQAGVLALSGKINTAILNSGGLISDQGYILGPNGSIITTGGLLTLGSAAATFAGAGVTSASHGVVALNLNNSGVVGFENSDMYLGAVGARIYSGTQLAPGSGNTYRFGGGAPWNAIGTATLGGSGGNLQVSTANVVTGAGNAVVIGDNSASIFGGLSSVEFTAAQNFGGTLSILGGSLQFTADNQLGSQAVTANSVLLDGGAANNGFNATLRYGLNTTVDESPRIGIVSGGTIDTGANNVVFGTALANANGGTGGLNKIGTGTLTLNKQNTYAGATGVTQGTLLLDLSAVNNVLSPTSTGLLLGGGNLSVKAPGAAAVASQTLSSTTFASGGSTITPILTAAPTTGTLTLALGTLNRTAGATGNIVFDTATNKVTTASTQITQSVTGGGTPTLITSPLGSAYLTFGTTAASVKDWAVIAAGSTQIVQAPAAFYTAAGATTLSGNADVVTATPTPTIAGAVGDNAIPSIRLSSTATSTLTLNGATSTFSVGGILLANGVGNVVTTLAGTATLQGPSGGTGDLVIQNWNSGFVTAAGASSSSTSNYLKIGGPIGGTGGVTFAGAPTALTFAATNGTWTGVTTINGAFVDIQANVPGGAPSVLGSATADPANLVLNGGGIYMDGGGNVALGRLFSLGVNGGTLTGEKTGAFTLNGTFNGSNAIGFVGTGARTLTLSGSGQVANTLGVSLGDNGGPSSLFKMGTGLWVLGVNNTYTGTTTIANGILRLAVPNALPGGVGVVGAVSPSTSGGGNLTFAGGAAQSVLELTAGSGNFYRGVGTGIDQVQWTGSGGFSAAGADFTVNLGGNALPTPLVWGSTAGFVSTGSLMLGSATASNKVIFQNPIDFNGGARTIAVDNGSAVIEAELSGNLMNGNASPVTFTKSGSGVLLLSGTNNTQGVVNTTTSAGTLIFANTNAVPGTGGRFVTVGASSAVVLQGATDLSPMLSRINTASTGVVAFDTSSSTALDLSDPALANIYIGAFSNPGGTPIYYNGIVTPGTNNTYKFANAVQASPGTATGGIGGAVNLLVLNGRNLLTNNGATPRSVILGGNSTQGGTGSIYLTSYNTYSGGTLIGDNQTANTNTEIGVGNDSAFGTGLITFNDGRIGGLNGDHTLSNNLKSTGTSGNMAVGGGFTADFIVNPGAMTYLGTADFSSLTTGGLFTRNAVVPAIFLGDVKTNAANNLTVLTTSSGAISVVEFLTTPAGAVATKTMNAGNKGFTIPGASPGGAAIVIDSAGSLGAGPSASVPTFFNLGGVTNATLQVLPGVTSTITLPANEGLTTSSGALFAFTVNGAPAINDSSNAPTSGLIGSSELVFPGVLSGTSSGAPAFSKLGYGTLTLQGQNTTIMSAGNGLAISNGTLKLDFALSPANASIFTVTNGMLLGSVAAISGNVGTVSTLATGPATLSLLGKSGQTNAQTFGPVTNAGKDNAIIVNSNGGTVNLTLGLITNTIGGTIAVTPAAQGTLAIAATNTTLVGGVSGTAAGLLADANLNPYVIVGGTDWGAKDASNNVVAATAFYTNNPDGTSFTANSQANLVSPVTLAATTTVGSLRINTNASPLSLTGNLITGGILMGTGTGTNDQVISGAGTLQGTQVTLAGKNLAIYQANTSAKLNISAVIANSAAATTTPATALSKAGPGTLVLSGTNTYTGVTYFNGGAISVGAVTAGGAAGPLGAASSAASNWVFNGGTMQYTGGTGTTDHGATFNAVSAIDVTQAGTTLTLTNSTISLTGAVSTPGILRKIGAGALTIGGTTGSDTNLSVEVAAGTLNLGKTGAGFAVQQANGAALIVDSGATARVTGTATTQIDPTSSVLVKTGGQLDLNAVGLTFDGLAGGGTVTSATGTPVLTLGMANDAAISAYTVGAAAAGAASSGLNNFSGVISGTIALTKAGAGTQIIGGGTSTYSGATTINTGTLKMGAANALPSGSGKGDVTIVGNLLLTGLIVPGTLDLGGFDQAINGLNSTTGGVVVNTPTVLFTTAWGTPYGTAATTGTSTLSVGNGNAAGAFNGSLQDGFSVLPVAGAGAGTGVNGVLALNKVGTGTQVLSGLNTYSGGTTVSGGLLQLSGSGTIGASTGGLTLAGGGLDLGGGTPTVSAFSITAAPASGNTLQNGSLTAPAYNISNPTGTATVSANLLGSAALTKSGAGILALTGTNNYSGGTTINGGTVQINSTSSLGAIAGGVVINSATLQATADITTTRSIQLGSATSTVAVDAGKTYSVSGVFSDGAATGTLNKSGLGTLVLTGTNLYNGGTNVAAGTLQVGAGGTAGTLGNGAITTGTNATLAINHSDPVTISTAIGGAGNFAQLGGGTTVLTGANGYAGTTTISGGTLQVGNGGTVGNLGAGAVTNNANLSFQRTDTVTIASTIGGSGTVTQTGGILNLNGAVTGQALHVASGQVNLGTGDTTAANPNHSLTALTIDAGTGVQVTAGAGVKLVQATSLALAGTATLDLTNNAFVLDYPGITEDPTKTAAIATLLQTGFNGGSWNGIGGITTSKVASDMAANPTTYQYLTGIGYMSGALTGGSFLGRAVDSGSVVARYTYYGDANLDGVVNGMDYGLIDSGFAAQHNAGFVYSWANGDFNYDGKIDGSDYALIDTAAAFTNGGPVAPDGPSSFAAMAPASFAAASSDAAPEEPLGAAPMAEMASLPTAVPEPATFGMLLLGGAMLGLRRRRAK